MTSELVDENGTTPGPDLPWNFEMGCVSMMNDTHAIITGGRQSSQKTMIARIEDLTITEGPELTRKYWTHGCSKLSHSNGTNYIVVAGGQSYGNRKIVDLLNVDSIDEGWFEGT